MQLPKLNAGDSAGLMEWVAFGAVLLSCAVAGIGASGIVGWGSLLAAVGTIVLVLGTFFTEFAASRLPVQAESRWRENRRAVGGLVVLGFLLLTAWNVTAGHMGMVAINEAGVADKRGPLVEAHARAVAARETAEEALEAFDTGTERQDAVLGDALRGAFAQGIVTRSTQALSGASGAREEQRRPLAEQVSTTRAAERQAEARLEAAPRGRPDHELWAFALVLELLKGALVWFCTPRSRKVDPVSADGAITVAPGGYDDMAIEDLDRIEKQARSIATSCQQAKRRIKARIAAAETAKSERKQRGGHLRVVAA